MQLQVDGALASRLYGIASSQGRDLDDVLHEAILEYVQRREDERQQQIREIVRGLMQKHAWLLEQLGKGPE